MPLRIAILGWGSLIWDPGNLPREGPWQCGGPVLPIEFSRVSKDCRLTLVIDPIAGSPVPTRYALSPRADLYDAAKDLMRRERTVLKHIGYLDVTTGRASLEIYEHQVPVHNKVTEWATSHHLDGVVWTALTPNFHDQTNVEFSISNALNYLHELPKAARQDALKYIRNAPREVDTPLRRELEALHFLSQPNE